jgi:hypothetical protein
MIGRWHGVTHEPPMTERALRNELRRHREQIIEWLAKKRDCAVTISGHYAAIRRLKTRAKRQGIAL